MTGAVPWVASIAQGEVRPAQPRREDLDSETREQCLVCLDGPRHYGFLHSGTMHLGVCGNCLPSVRQRGVTECIVCRSRIDQIIRVH
ncbi:hypothetical protein DUNSADRAFT_16648 [Dunaliella salina]|uniref:RING-type domain-containing protein n=1 Tax=Dunaliella salina TaxID=3046 RepID=A0ABQ7G365_DUNSA|nr:hypothetical protein DUNSADRAFT_16648 [Dunaliella salina]|eukprot:KAF5829044.1 hypothetical protein DUNSADRAFT_16648 [Dunaliella salina]